MTTPLVQIPGGFAPVVALGFGAAQSEAVPCDAAHPLPVADRAFVGARALPIGATAAPGRAIAVVCTAAGNAALRLANDSVLSVPVEAGLSVLPFAVVRVEAAGTTALADFSVLD